MWASNAQRSGARFATRVFSKGGAAFAVEDAKKRSGFPDCNALHGGNNA